MVKNNLKQLLKLKKITQSELSRKSGISKYSLSQMATGKTNSIRHDTLDKLCEALECDINDILMYTPNNKR